MWTMIRRRSFSITTPIFALLTLAIFGLIWLPLGVLLAAWLVYAQEIKPMLLADRLHKLWLSLPTVKQYREKLPVELHYVRGMICSECRSRSIYNRGWLHKNDFRRYFVCNHCNSTLYRA